MKRNFILFALALLVPIFGFSQKKKGEKPKRLPAVLRMFEYSYHEQVTLTVKISSWFSML